MYAEGRLGCPVRSSYLYRDVQLFEPLAVFAAEPWERRKEGLRPWLGAQGNSVMRYDMKKGDRGLMRKANCLAIRLIFAGSKLNQHQKRHRCPDFAKREYPLLVLAPPRAPTRAPTDAWHQANGEKDPCLFPLFTRVYNGGLQPETLADRSL
eukprot:1151477-Pelagomonas_calceolata.AAC.6